MSDTIRPYKAKASPKINIKIIPTKIFSCCAFARTPASPTIPIANPADWIIQYLRENWIRSRVLMPNGHKLIYQCSFRWWLHQKIFTFLDNNNSDDHTIDTQDTGHDDWDDWLHNEFGLEDSHWADTDSGFGTSVSSSEIGEDQSWGDSDVSEEVLGAVSSFTSWHFLLVVYD